MNTPTPMIPQMMPCETAPGHALRKERTLSMMANFLSVVLNTQTDALMGASCPLKKSCAAKPAFPAPRREGLRQSRLPGPARRGNGSSVEQRPKPAKSAPVHRPAAAPLRAAPRLQAAGGRKTAVGAMQTKSGSLTGTDAGVRPRLFRGLKGGYFRSSGTVRPSWAMASSLSVRPISALQYSMGISAMFAPSERILIACWAVWTPSW